MYYISPNRLQYALCGRAVSGAVWMVPRPLLAPLGENLSATSYLVTARRSVLWSTMSRRVFTIYLLIAHTTYPVSGVPHLP